MRQLPCIEIRAGLAPVVLLLSVACGGEDSTTVQLTSEALSMVRPDPDPSGTGDDSAESEAAGRSGAVPPGAHVRTSRDNDGSYSSEVDATDMASWIHFSFATGAEVAVDVAEQSELWHLGFQRSNVKLNGGESGIGSVSVAATNETFESVAGAPQDGYLEDAGDQDMDGTPDYALSAGDGWYSYDPATHVLAARETVFVLETTDGFYKLQFLSYYDSAGTPAMLSFRWAPLGGS